MFFTLTLFTQNMLRHTVIINPVMVLL